MNRSVPASDAAIQAIRGLPVFDFIRSTAPRRPSRWSIVNVGRPGIGCIDCKKMMSRFITGDGPILERRRELEETPQEVLGCRRGQ